MWKKLVPPLSSPTVVKMNDCYIAEEIRVALEGACERYPVPICEVLDGLQRSSGYHKWRSYSDWRL